MNPTPPPSPQKKGLSTWPGWPVTRLLQYSYPCSYPGSGDMSGSNLLLVLVFVSRVLLWTLWFFFLHKNQHSIFLFNRDARALHCEYIYAPLGFEGRYFFTNRTMWKEVELKCCLISLNVTECFCFYLQSIRPATKVVMKIVSCPPTVQVVVNRPDTKYQLGFSVQNGMVKQYSL